MRSDLPELKPLSFSGGRRAEQVVVAVREAINSGRMRPGRKYSVYQLAEQLQLSRTPVRDALLRLEEVGAIQFEPRQGFRVLLPQPRDIAEIFAVRVALEVPAARRVALKCDDDLKLILSEIIESMEHALHSGDQTLFEQQDRQLHDLIMNAAGNLQSRKIVASMRESTRLLGAATVHRTRTLAEIHDEHVPVVSAIVDNDVDGAERAMRNHLEVTGRLLVSQATLDQGLKPESTEVWLELLA